MPEAAPTLTAANSAEVLAKWRYDPSLLPKLEAYVDQQCASQEQ